MPSLAVTVHSFDRANAQDSLSHAERLVDIKVQHSKRYANEIGELARAGLERACLAAALDPTRPELLDFFRMAARAHAASFAVHRSGGQPIDVLVTSEAPIRLQGSIPPSMVGAKTLIEGFFCALIARDPLSLALLSAVPDEGLSPAGVVAPEYLVPFAGALRAFTTRRRDVAQLLLHVLRLTDPAQLDRAVVDYVLSVDVPLLDLILAVIQGRADAIPEKLRVALEGQREHYAHYPFAFRGYVALGCTAFACVAMDRGTPPGVSSGYVPVAVLPTPPSSTLICCPYCITPIGAAAQYCPGCLNDASSDARVELSSDEWWSTDFQSCRHCEGRILPLAVVCPTCRKRQ